MITIDFNTLDPSTKKTLDDCWRDFLRFMATDIADHPENAEFPDDDWKTWEQEADWEASKLELESNHCLTCEHQLDAYEPYSSKAPCNHCAYGLWD